MDFVVLALNEYMSLSFKVDESSAFVAGEKSPCNTR